MKKLIIYAIFVVFCAFGIYFGYAYMQEKRFNPTVVPFVEQAVPQLSQWDVERTKALLDEETLKRVTDHDLEQMMNYLARIGELQDFAKPRFRSTSKAMTTGAVERDVVTYRIKAEYSSGPVEITLSMVERDGEYRLLSFNFQSQALAP